MLLFFKKVAKNPKTKLTPLHRFFFWFRKAQKKKLCKKKTPRKFRSLRRATAVSPADHDKFFENNLTKNFLRVFVLRYNKKLSRYRWGVRESYLRKILCIKFNQNWPPLCHQIKTPSASSFGSFLERKEQKNQKQTNSPTPLFLLIPQGAKEKAL